MTRLCEGCCHPIKPSDRKARYMEVLNPVGKPDPGQPLKRTVYSCSTEKETVYYEKYHRWWCGQCEAPEVAKGVEER